MFSKFGIHCTVSIQVVFAYILIFAIERVSSGRAKPPKRFRVSESPDSNEFIIDLSNISHIWFINAFDDRLKNFGALYHNRK